LNIGLKNSGKKFKMRAVRRTSKIWCARLMALSPGPHLPLEEGGIFLAGFKNIKIPGNFGVSALIF